MRKRAMALFASHADAQPIMCTGSVPEKDFRLQLAIGCRFQDFFIDKRNVPFRQVFGSHGQFTCRVEPTPPFLWRESEGAETVTQIACWIGRSKFLVINVTDTSH